MSLTLSSTASNQETALAWSDANLLDALNSTSSNVDAAAGLLRLSHIEDLPATTDLRFDIKN